MAIIVCVAIVIYKMGSIIVPFALSFVIAYVLRKPRDTLSNRLKLPKIVSTFLILILAFTLIIASITLFVPLIKSTIEKAITKMPAILNIATDFIANKINDVYNFLKIKQTINIKADINRYMADILQHACKYVPSIITAGKAIINMVLISVLVPILSFYMLYDFETIEKHLVKFIMSNFSKRSAVILKKINNNIDKYITGQILICSILIAIYSIVFSVIGIDDCIVCAIITGIMSFIPFCGSLFSMIITIAMSIDTITSMQIYCIIGTYAVVMMIDSNLITPNLIGRKIGVKPLMLLFVICMASALFGFIGMILSIPLSIIIVTIIQSSCHHTP